MLRNLLKVWWPGTELNRRRQPFQGCALPPELPGHACSSTTSLPRPWNESGGDTEERAVENWNRGASLIIAMGLQFAQWPSPTDTIYSPEEL